MSSVDQPKSDAAEMFLNFCRQAKVDQIELGIYRYVPQTVTDKRRVLKVSVRTFERSFAALIKGLDEHEDVAIHSRVRKKIAGRSITLHVPVIDLRGNLDEHRLKELLSMARDFGAKQTAVFFSGRSFHVYAYTLIPTKNWAAFMGRCLLLNRPDSSEFVDSRWVGHRLVAGYGSLRWTWQNKWYQGAPVYKAGFDLPGPRRQQPAKDSHVLPRLEFVQPWLF